MYDRWNGNIQRSTAAWACCQCDSCFLNIVDSEKTKTSHKTWWNEGCHASVKEDIDLFIESICSNTTSEWICVSEIYGYCCILMKMSAKKMIVKSIIHRAVLTLLNLRKWALAELAHHRSIAARTMKLGARNIPTWLTYTMNLHRSFEIVAGSIRYWSASRRWTRITPQ